MRTQITQAVLTALGGSREVKITFKREATVAQVAFLLGMASAGIIQLNEQDEALLECVVLSKDWGGDRNRTTTLTLTDKFDKDWFVGRMERALEKIEVVN